MKDHQILVPLDGSVLAECVLPHVIALGRVFNSSIILLRVISSEDLRKENQMIDPVSWEMKKAEAISYLKEKKEQLEKYIASVDYHFFEGKPADKILEYSRQNVVDLIALSSHGESGLNEWNISSVVQKITMQCQRSILLIRAYHSIDEGLSDVSYKRLAALLDCSKRAELVIPVATTIARFYDAQLTLTHIVQNSKVICYTSPSIEDLNLSKKLTEVNKKYAKEYIDSLQTQLVHQEVKVNSIVDTSDRPSETIHNLLSGEKIDLVLLTAHGTTGSQKWPYGSLATSFFLYGSVPVILLQDLKPEDIEISEAEIAAKEYKGH